MFGVCEGTLSQGENICGKLRLGPSNLNGDGQELKDLSQVHKFGHLMFFTVLSEVLEIGYDLSKFNGICLSLTILEKISIL